MSHGSEAFKKVAFHTAHCGKHAGNSLVFCETADTHLKLPLKRLRVLLPSPPPPHEQQPLEQPDNKPNRNVSETLGGRFPPPAGEPVWERPGRLMMSLQPHLPRSAGLCRVCSPSSQSADWQHLPASPSAPLPHCFSVLVQETASLRLWPLSLLNKPHQGL